MSFHGAVRLLVVAYGRRADAAPAVQDAIPEIQPGGFAAWAREDQGSPPLPLALGAACRTVDGCAGRIVEVLDEGRTVLVCTPA